MTSAGPESAAPEAIPFSRAVRRNARTRQKLIDAARVVLAARPPRRPASRGAGELFDQLGVDVDDAALAMAESVRLTLRLCRSRPQTSAVLIRHGMHITEAETGVAPPRTARGHLRRHQLVADAADARPPGGFPGSVPR